MAQADEGHEGYEDDEDDEGNEKGANEGHEGDEADGSRVSSTCNRRHHIFLDCVGVSALLAILNKVCFCLRMYVGMSGGQRCALLSAHLVACLPMFMALFFDARSILMLIRVQKLL